MIINLEWEVLLHETYSPNLSSSDLAFVLLYGHHFQQNMETFGEEFIGSKQESFFHDGIHNLAEGVVKYNRKQEKISWWLNNEYVYMHKK